MGWWETLVSWHRTYPTLPATTGLQKNCSEKHLNQIRNWFLRLVLQVRHGASLAPMSWDTFMLDMPLRVNMYLRNLEDTTLAKRVYEEEKFKEWRYIAADYILICQTKQSKEDYKKNSSPSRSLKE